jgi:putative DNA primase/helicase
MASERKERDKAKSRRALFQRIAGESTAKREAEIRLWASTFEEDPAMVTAEFREYVTPTVDPEPVKPAEIWSEPVDGAELAMLLEQRIAKHIFMISEAGEVATVVWIFLAWLHDAIAAYSPILAFWGEPGQGKTTSLNLVAFLTPRPHREVQPGISLYQTIDSEHPTLIIDEGQDLFRRKYLAAIINSSWQRGFPVYRKFGRGPRMPFDVFCPKAVGLLTRNGLEPATAERMVLIEMQAPTPAEAKALEPFWNRDDAGLKELRMKLAKWAVDNAEALKDSRPEMPIGFVGRVGQNWSLLFAIGDRLGGEWPQRLRKAAMQLAPDVDDQNASDAKRLLSAFRGLFEQVGRAWVYSEEVYRHLTDDPLSSWNLYHGHRISQIGIANLLRKTYGICHRKVGPKDRRLHGYRADDFRDRFLRILQNPLPEPGLSDSEQLCSAAEEGSPGVQVTPPPSPEKLETPDVSQGPGSAAVEAAVEEIPAQPDASRETPEPVAEFGPALSRRVFHDGKFRCKKVGSARVRSKAS